MKTAWQRLIRFEDDQGRILYGEPILPKSDFDLGKAEQADGLKAKVISGSDIFDTTGQTTVTNQTANVKQILGPLRPADVPILRCVGLNYAKHSKFESRIRHLQMLIKFAVKEAGRSPPPHPFIFFKPNTCVVGHNENVVIPKIAQDDQADYEGEIVVLSFCDLD